MLRTDSFLYFRNDKYRNGSAGEAARKMSVASGGIRAFGLTTAVVGPAFGGWE